MSQETRIHDLATRAGAENKALRTLINNNAADLSALTTTAKTDLVAAINEVDAAGGGGATINDGTTATDSVWSSDKTNTEISAAVSGLVDSSPAALDTLNELAAALGDDANFSTTINTALGNRIRYDAAQSLTVPQQAQALSNIGATAATDIGDTDANFVTTFEAALV